MTDALNRPGAQPALRAHGGFSFGALARRPEAGSFLGMAIAFVFFAILGGTNVVTPGGFASRLDVASGIGIVALPIGPLTIAGELDTSIGSVVPAASMTVAIISGTCGLPLILGAAAALGLGLPSWWGPFCTSRAGATGSSRRAATRSARGRRRREPRLDPRGRRRGPRPAMVEGALLGRAHGGLQRVGYNGRASLEMEDFTMCTDAGVRSSVDAPPATIGR